MERVLKLVHEIIAAGRRDWTLQGGSIVVQLGRSKRTHRINLGQHRDQIVLRSTVLGATRVTQNARRWRDLVRHAWRRNAEHDLVTFAFDGGDRLLGLIRHPVAMLSRAELELFVDTLARECDRFEYILTGRDVS